MSAKEKSTPSNPQPNKKTCQHCRPKPSPSSTAVPIRHGPARGDVRHQELQDVQGGGRVHVEEGQVLRHPPAEGDAHHVHHAQAKEGLDAKAPRKGGVRVQADVEQVLRHPPAQGDAHHRTRLFKMFLKLPQELRVGLTSDFLYIFSSCTYFLNSCVLLNSCVHLKIKTFSSTRKVNPSARRGIVKDFSSTRKMDPSARGGVVVDIVNSNLCFR